MVVSLHDLEVKTVDIAETFAPGKIDFGEDTNRETSRSPGARN
jgi:hypothetical protein